jgi:hypothetical protein
MTDDPYPRIFPSPVEVKARSDAKFAAWMKDQLAEKEQDR